MTTETTPDCITGLLRADAYDHPVDAVRLVQTHISYVLIAGDFVYKVKKPVDFGFLDFTTLDKRAYYCAQEIVLNRRLCPDIYLARVPVYQDGAACSFRTGGDICDYAVKMVRMPEEKMMGRLLAAGELTRGHLDRIVDILVPFYAGAAVDEEIRSYGQPRSVAVNVVENFTQTESFLGAGALDRSQFDLIRGYAMAVLADEKRFYDRIEAGRVRDCHGDLYSANICLADQIHVFDCIEFNDRFRYSDVAGDIGFLAMDLDYHGEEELAAHFVDRFAAAAEDDGLAGVIDFYKCYRAYVRAKIQLFTAADPALDRDAAAACTEQARRYFALAERYARHGS